MRQERIGCPGVTMTRRPDDTVPPVAASAEAGVSGAAGIAGNLGDEDVAVAGDIFRQVTATFGIDGAPVFERLLSGQSIGEALSVAPAVIDALYARAYAWFSHGRTDRALVLFRALCVLDGSQADYWVGYGVCLRATQRPDSEVDGPARQAFDIAARLRPDWAIPHFHALELAVAGQDWDRARTCLSAYEERATADIAPTIVQEARRLRAVVDMRQGTAGRRP